MNISELHFWGTTKYWWIVMLAGIILVPMGIWMVISPNAGYAVISLLLGWALVAFGVVQLLISSDSKRHQRSWSWWMAGGIFDIFVGFFLVGNLLLSELMLPFFFAFTFLFKGISNIISSISMYKIHRYWWLYIINGILMILISIIFFYVPYMSSYVIVFLSAFAFVYWGMTLIAFSMDLKPNKTNT